jgi:outer membrane protein TolC
MKTRKIYLPIFLSLTLFVVSAEAQTSNFPLPTSSYPLTLETVMKLAGSNNLTVHEYQLKNKEALADVNKSKEWWLPNIYAGASTHYLNGAAMNTDGKIFTGVSQNNFWSGLGFGAEIDFSKGKYQTLAAQQNAEAIGFQENAEKNKAILAAIESYYDLQTEQLKYIFMRQLVNRSDTLSQQIKIKVDAGLMYQSEYLLSQSNYHHLQITMLQAKANWQKISAQLTSLLNLKESPLLISADKSLIPLQLSTPTIDTSNNKNGFENRPEYSELNSELNSFQTLRQSAHKGFLLPKLRIGMDNGAFGAYTGPVKNTYQVNASLLWQLPLGRLTYKGDLKQWDRKIDLQQNKVDQFKNQYQREIAQANSQIQSADEQMTIGKQALQSATEAMNQSIGREKIGTAKAYEVFQAQQFYLQAQLDYLNSVADYNKGQYALKVAEGEIL